MNVPGLKNIQLATKKVETKLSCSWKKDLDLQAFVRLEKQLSDLPDFLPWPLSGKSFKFSEP